jgi:hypothetical protein
MTPGRNAIARAITPESGAPPIVSPMGPGWRMEAMGVVPRYRRRLGRAQWRGPER